MKRGIRWLLLGLLVWGCASVSSHLMGRAITEAWRDIYANNLFAQYLFTGNISAPVLTVTSGTGEIQQGSQWLPSLKLLGAPGSAIYGPLTLNNNSGGGPGV